MVFAVVVVLWVEIGRLTDLSQSKDLPSLVEVGTFARTVMNATAATQAMLGRGSTLSGTD